MNENHQPEFGTAPMCNNRTIYCLVSETAIQQQEHSINATNTHFSPTFPQNAERWFGDPSRGTRVTRDSPVISCAKRHCH